MLVGSSGLSYEDAAKICGCQVGTIKSRVSRARRELKERLEANHKARIFVSSVKRSHDTAEKQELEQIPNGLNHSGFPKGGDSDSRCRLVKEASLHDETSFK